MKKMLILAFAILSLSATPNCNLAMNTTKDMLLDDNTVAQEDKFLASAKSAVKACEDDIADEANTLKAFILLGKKNCEDFGNQRSLLFSGHCYLQLAQALNQYGY